MSAPYCFGHWMSTLTRGSVLRDSLAATERDRTAEDCESRTAVASTENRMSFWLGCDTVSTHAAAARMKWQVQNCNETRKGFRRTMHGIHDHTRRRSVAKCPALNNDAQGR
jgi:hypothetical protein